MNQDAMYERRELTRNVHIESRHLQRNIHASLLAQLRMKYEGVCLPEGFVQPRTITILEHSLGRTSLIRGGLDYSVRFQAAICFPHPGQVFRAPVSLKSKIGLHAESAPLKILLPRDIHIGNGDFDGIQEGQEIEFEVVGIRFQQGDESIVVLAKLRDIISANLQAETATVDSGMEGLIAAPVSSEGSDKKVVTVSIDQTKAPGEVRRKKLVAKPKE
jgi:DNA-directed RNA polymerase subunit E'/Rpb7